MIVFAPLYFLFKSRPSRICEICNGFRRSSETGYLASGTDLHQGKWRSIETGVTGIAMSNEVAPDSQSRLPSGALRRPVGFSRAALAHPKVAVRRDGCGVSAPYHL